MAIQPKNTNEIRVDIIDEKTAAAGVSIAHAKELLANGADLTIGTESADDVVLKTNNTARLMLTSAGNLEQDATNGGSITLTKASTIVTPGVCSTTLTAAGTTISDALDLTAFFSNLTTVASGAGAQLWDAPLNSMLIVRNQGANALLLYPHNNTDATLNGGSVGASVSVASGAMAIAFRVSSTNWIVVEFTVAAA